MGKVRYGVNWKVAGRWSFPGFGMRLDWGGKVGQGK